jgi:hypothetical protein
MDVNHMLIVKKFEEEVKSQMNQTKGKQPTKTRANISKGSISIFFTMKNSFQKEDVPQK